MSRPGLFTALAAVLIAGSAGCIAITYGIHGDGRVGRTDRPVQGFDRVRVEGSLDAVVHAGKPFACRVFLDDNLQDMVVAHVEKKTLVVYVRAPGIHPSKGSRVEIDLPKLAELGTSGSGDATVSVPASSDPLALSTSGSGNLALTGEVGALTVSMSGSGHAKLQGRAQSLSLDASGSGDVDARALVAHDATVDLSGSGDARLHLDGGTARFGLSGSASITWSGQAHLDKVDISGSGRIRHVGAAPGS